MLLEYLDLVVGEGGQYVFCVVADGEEGESFFDLNVEKQACFQGELLCFFTFIVEAEQEADGAALDEVGLDV